MLQLGRKAKVACNGLIFAAAFFTRLKQTTEISMLAVFRNPDPASRLGIMGDYLGPNYPGVGIIIPESNVDEVQFIIENDAGYTQPTKPLPRGEGAFNLVGCSIPDGAGATTFNQEYRNTQADAYMRAISTTDNIRIGANENQGFQTPVDIALAMIWNRAISDSEITTMIDWCTTYLAGYGIDISDTTRGRLVA